MTNIRQIVRHRWLCGCILDRDLDHRISTSGYVFNLFGGEINWMRKIEDVVAVSTT
jgi:hypothetical protein